MKRILNLIKINTSKVSLLSSSVVIILISLSPYLLYIYNYLPSTAIWESPFGDISSGLFQNFKNYVYFLFGKFVPLLLLFLWFITNKNWWYHCIIIPISVYMFQFISLVNDGIELVDEMEFIYTVPITTIVITILYFIRSQLVVYLEAVDLKKQMEKNFN